MTYVRTSVEPGQRVYVLASGRVLPARVRSVLVTKDRFGAEERFSATYSEPDPFRPGQTRERSDWCMIGRPYPGGLAAFLTRQIAEEALEAWKGELR